MVLWRAKTLALDLRDGRVAERDKLGYLLVGLLIQAIIGRASLLSALRSLGARAEYPSGPRHQYRWDYRGVSRQYTR